MASISSSTTVSVTVAHAVSYLVRPLSLRYSTGTLARLQATLEANLTAIYQNNWTPSDPLRGSGRRCLTLSPACLPPRAVYDACVASQVQWADWIRALGGREFDLFIDPGRVAIRIGGASSEPQIVWSERLEAQAQLEALRRMQKSQAGKQGSGKTLAQLLMEQDDESDDEIFSMIADEVRAPTWMTPLINQFPKAPTPPVVVPSRSSSRSSFASSAFSIESEESATSWSSSTSLSCSPSSYDSSLPSSDMMKAGSKASRRERARQARVFIDNSKNEVTPYDGGKTTVLTGGVMLGAPRVQSSATRRL